MSTEQRERIARECFSGTRGYGAWREDLEDDWRRLSDYNQRMFLAIADRILALSGERPAPVAEPNNRCGCGPECRDRHDCRYLSGAAPVQPEPPKVQGTACQQAIEILMDLGYSYQAGGWLLRVQPEQWTEGTRRARVHAALSNEPEPQGRVIGKVVIDLDAEKTEFIDYLESPEKRPEPQGRDGFFIVDGIGLPWFRVAELLKKHGHEVYVQPGFKAEPQGLASAIPQAGEVERLRAQVLELERDIDALAASEADPEND